MIFLLRVTGFVWTVTFLGPYICLWFNEKNDESLFLGWENTLGMLLVVKKSFINWLELLITYINASGKFYVGKIYPAFEDGNDHANNCELFFANTMGVK